jgi:hypothetical protein
MRSNFKEEIMENNCCLVCSHSGKVSPLTELINCTKFNYGVSPNSLACKNFELEKETEIGVTWIGAFEAGLEGKKNKGIWSIFNISQI